MTERRSWCRHYARATVGDKRAAGAAFSSPDKPAMVVEVSRGEIVRMVFWRSRAEKKAEAPASADEEGAAKAGPQAASSRSESQCRPMS